MKTDIPESGTPDHSTPPGAGRRSIPEVAFAALVACCAYAGAIGLVTGSLDLGDQLNQRLPLHSPVLGGVALAAIVGLPASVVVRLVWRRDTRAGLAATGAGVLLVAWIGVEVAFIREFSFLQPTFVAVGLAFVALGRRSTRSHSRSIAAR